MGLVGYRGIYSGVPGKLPENDYHNQVWYSGIPDFIPYQMLNTPYRCAYHTSYSLSMSKIKSTLFV